MNLTLAAQTVGVTKRTIYNWLRWGYVPYTVPQPWRRQVQLPDVQAAKQRYYRKRRAS